MPHSAGFCSGTIIVKGAAGVYCVDDILFNDSASRITTTASSFCDRFRLENIMKFIIQ